MRVSMRSAFIVLALMLLLPLTALSSPKENVCKGGSWQALGFNSERHCAKERKIADIKVVCKDGSWRAFGFNSLVYQGEP